MSERKINLEKIYEQYERITRFSEDNSFMEIKKNRLKAMKEACRQTLELAAENAKVIKTGAQKKKMPTGSGYKFTFVEVDIIEVNKQSILNTINQIE